MPVQYTIDQDSCAWRIVDGEAILIHAETTFYYGLDATGTRIWQILLDGPASVAEVEARLQAGGVDAPSASAIEAFLEELRAEEILTRSGDGAVETTTTDAAPGGAPPPLLTKYDSLDELLISGE